MKVAHQYRIPYCGQFWINFLEGQNIHTRGPYSISLSFQNMNQIVAFHPDDLDIVVQPGVGWQELDDFCWVIQREKFEIWSGSWNRS